MPEKTLLALADHGQADRSIAIDGGDAEQVIAAYNEAGFDDDALAARLQSEGKDSFAKSWHDLTDSISRQLQAA
jgi:transaldolase